MTKECLKEPLKFESLEELEEVMELLDQHYQEFGTMWEISPIEIGGKIGFVNWGLNEIIAKPEYDEFFGTLGYRTPYNCIRKGERWGVLCYDGTIESPVEHSKFMAMMLRDELNIRVRVEGVYEREQYVA